jgi:very-short-patch-repair endonuclease
MRRKGARPDAAIAAIAARQHGIVSRRQLLEVGLGESAITRRVEVGRLYRIHRGVYAVGHCAISQHGQWQAAVLACGDGAAVSDQSAAALWGLLSATRGPVHVTVPSAGGRKRQQGIRLHRRVSLLPEYVTRHRGIPVTTPARTVDDLRRAVSAAELRRAIRQAEMLGLSLGEESRSDRTRSDLERDFLRLCRRHGLPTPEVNVRVGRHLADFLWRDRRLIVETDGYRYHRGRQAFEDDRARDLRLRALGFEVLRLSYRQVSDEPAAVAKVLGAVLASPLHRVRIDGR